jgi:hypothetical protein
MENAKIAVGGSPDRSHRRHALSAKRQTTSIGFASGSGMVRPLGPNAAVAIAHFAAPAMFC